VKKPATGAGFVTNTPVTATTVQAAAVIR